MIVIFSAITLCVLSAETILNNPKKALKTTFYIENELHKNFVWTITKL